MVKGPPYFVRIIFDFRALRTSRSRKISAIKYLWPESRQQRTYPRFLRAVASKTFIFSICLSRAIRWLAQNLSLQGLAENGVENKRIACEFPQVYSLATRTRGFFLFVLCSGMGKLSAKPIMVEFGNSRFPSAAAARGPGARVSESGTAFYLRGRISQNVFSNPSIEKERHEEIR